MKKCFLIFLFSLTSIFLFYSFYKYFAENKYKSRSHFNNLEAIVPDSIDPLCVINSKSFSDKSIISLRELKIMIPESRRWSKNLLNAKLSSKDTIQDKYKKKFKGFVLFDNKKEICKLKATIRISGDFKDHIKYMGDDILSSLDIKLDEGNINGIIRFKLFLPHTRNESSEVITSLLFKKMGYLAPRTRFILADVNNTKHQMIMQEKVSKEMIENNNFRESAIFASDESLMWKLRLKKDLGFNNYIFPKVVNKSWLKKGDVHRNIALKGFDIFSRAILESWNLSNGHDEVSYNDLILSNGDLNSKSLLSRYRAHLIAMKAFHGLINHNRKFFYKTLSNSLVPVYYDGDSNIRSFTDLNQAEIKYLKKTSSFQDISLDDIQKAIKEIDLINSSKFANTLNILGVKSSELEIKKIKSLLKRNLTILEEINTNRHKKKTFLLNKDPLIRDQIYEKKYGIVFRTNDSDFAICTINNSECQKKILKENELIGLLSGNYSDKDLHYYYLGSSFNPFQNKYIDKNSSNTRLPILISKDGNNINIIKKGNPTIDINYEKKLIYIYLNEANDKVMILESYIKDWQINMISKKSLSKKVNKNRFDTNLLTGSFTILDSKLDNIKISINGGYLEDSLNIINSTGFIKSIKIENSFQDAIDLDFSDLKIDQVIVKNSGNDCLDVSSGKYYIQDLYAKNCFDKGVSVGEKSFMNIDNVDINSAKISLVSKDSSKLKINTGEIKNYAHCAAVYVKKQEFGPSEITFENNICPKERILIQNFSSINYK